MKLLINIWFLVFLGSNYASAQGAGVRGGGEVSRGELYDLVSPYTCTWVNGNQMIRENKEVVGLLNKVSRLDWYFAASILNEIRQLKFCKTSQLLPVLKKINPSPGKSYFKERAAFRLGNEVWWDVDLAATLPAKSRAWLLIHESLHTWMEYNIDSAFYYQNLWSTVVTLNKVVEGMIKTLDEMYFQLEQNLVRFPRHVRSIDIQTRRVLEFIFSSESAKSQAILNSKNPEQLIQLNTPLPPQIRAALLTQDAMKLESQFDLESQLLASIQSIMKNGTLDNFKSLFKKTYTRINPLALALAIFDQLKSDKQKELIPHLEGSFLTIVKLLNSAEVSVESRPNFVSFTVNEAFTKLTQMGSLKRPFYLRNIVPFSLKTDIATTSSALIDAESQSISIGNSKVIAKLETTSGGTKVGSHSESVQVILFNDASVSAEFKALAQLTVHMIRTQQGDNIIKLLKENAEFKSVFDSEKWIRQIESFEPTIAREKEVGITIAKQTADRAYLKFMELIESQVTQMQYDWFLKLLN